MTIIVDTNILISALLNPNSSIGEMLMRGLVNVPKYSCYFLFVEVFDKKEKIIKYARMEEAKVLELLLLTLKKIQFFNENQISAANKQQARQLTEDIDVKDVSFVALAIELNAKLWTGDKKLYKGLKVKGFDDVVNLSDLREIMKK